MLKQIQTKVEVEMFGDCSWAIWTVVTKFIFGKDDYFKLPSPSRVEAYLSEFIKARNVVHGGQVKDIGDAEK